MWFTEKAVPGERHSQWWNGTDKERVDALPAEFPEGTFLDSTGDSAVGGMALMNPSTTLSSNATKGSGWLVSVCSAKTYGHRLDVGSWGLGANLNPVWG